MIEGATIVEEFARFGNGGQEDDGDFGEELD